MREVFERVGDGVTAIDTLLIRPRMDASHLIVDAGRAAFVDAGTAFSTENLLAALAAQNLEVDAVDYVLLTHVHLDHAGGAGRLMRHLPRAQVLLHPLGVRHIVDPSILVAAAKAVYGEVRFEREYGEVEAIAAERVQAVQDGWRIALGTRTLEFVHTPGHALHHLCIVDLASAEIYTGDTFGVSYRELDTDDGAFIFPTTSPTQFDPAQLHASIHRILEYQPTTAYLTHYSRVDQLEKLAADLHSDIDVFVSIARSCADRPDPVPRMETALFDHLAARLEAHGFSGSAAAYHAMLDGDVTLNAAGLHAWLSRRKG
jgi:glyoxylase-like metal-dependent hydrolase (beta-lactamase superfamily II)